MVRGGGSRRRRYCGESCQKAAWSKGHKTDCKRIARAGGYEQAKAVEEAAKAARAAKPGAGACGICGQDGGPVVHGCGCASPAHLKCLERAARDFETNTYPGGRVENASSMLALVMYFRRTAPAV